MLSWPSAAPVHVGESRSALQSCSLGEDYPASSACQEVFLANFFDIIFTFDFATCRKESVLDSLNHSIPLSLP